MFGTTICGHCGKTGTKAQEISPSGANFKQVAICCSSCSAILGVTGFFDVGAVVKVQEKKIDAMTHQIGDLTRAVEDLQRQLRQ
ncbi:hypothetical protein OS190_09480 [Sulfitobacter sp. F26204]|uniref:hypothetical protein n=1 Tax=Sulfitobacter sp. F26204 TaxID=2996014 RepID=UPI00225E4D7E|nr:hypothetical protein [Sulfitobacter sp. F26204]MCX7559798.1 hypothetical protein [Sulfitobacter sp. F26204]